MPRLPDNWYFVWSPTRVGADADQSWGARTTERSKVARSFLDKHHIHQAARTMPGGESLCRDRVRDHCWSRVVESKIDTGRDGRSRLLPQTAFLLVACRKSHASFGSGRHGSGSFVPGWQRLVEISVGEGGIHKYSVRQKKTQAEAEGFCLCRRREVKRRGTMKHLGL